MVDRAHKPMALVSTPRFPPQAQVDTSEPGRVTAKLPTGESVTVLLHGATVISWKDSFGNEQLWLSKAAVLDGSKAIRGGIPVVFPVFGTAPDKPAVAGLPQHGFARTSRWEFLGKSTSESEPRADGGVKLDFMLSRDSLDPAVQKLWPYRFGLIYSVELDRESLKTGLVVNNEGEEPFEFQALLHTYLKVEDISLVTVKGLSGASYVDKVDGAKTKQEGSAPLTIASETDRVYTPADGSSSAITVCIENEDVFTIVRENLDDVVVWNPWTEKAAGMADFEPKEGFRNMLCVEAGSVRGWQKLEEGDTFEGAQIIKAN